MPTDIDTLSEFAKLLVDAANDTENAFATKGKSAAEFLSLIPEVIGLSTKLGDFKTEGKDLDEDDLQALVKVFSDGLSLPEGKAKDIGAQAFPVLQVAVDFGEKIKALSEVIAGHKEAPVAAPSGAPSADPAPAQ